MLGDASPFHRLRESYYGSRVPAKPRLPQVASLRSVSDWETVREIALSFPVVEESSEGRPAFRARGKLFAWEARERDGGGLAVRVDRDEKQLILDSNPAVYFSSPHYDGTRESRSGSSRSIVTSSRSGSRTPG